MFGQFFGDLGAFLAANWLAILFAAVNAYLLGSINFAIIVSRLFTGEDVRTKGSGNAGTTNVLRSVGKLPALLTLLGDLAKIVAAVLVARMIFLNFGADSTLLSERLYYAAYLAGVFCLLGHLYPCYFGFRGGKGVLTTAGMALLVDWRVFLIVIAIFVLVMLFSRTVSLSSVCAAAAYPVCTFLIVYFADYLPDPTQVNFDRLVASTVITAIMGGIVIFRHRSNIKRLLAGEEKKLGVKKEGQ